LTRRREHAEEGEEVGGLAHEQVVEEYVGNDKDDAGHARDRPPRAPARRSPR